MAYTVLAVVMSLMVTFSGMMKIRRDPRTTKIINEVVGVSLKFFSFLAGCEFAGAIGLLVGIAWPLLGMAASAGLVFYFVGAGVGHVRVGDFRGVGPAAFMLCVSGACLLLRVRGVKGAAEQAAEADGIAMIRFTPAAQRQCWADVSRIGRCHA